MAELGLAQTTQKTPLPAFPLFLCDCFHLFRCSCFQPSCHTIYLKAQGKNTSTVIPASCNRRRKGNPVVSDEAVMYGYKSPATLTTDRLHYKLQIRPLVREGAPRRRAMQLSGKRKEKQKSGHGPQRGARHQDG
jgi:hypothetical protein